MKRNISIQLKAVLLLLVFAMNTVVGSACAGGLDMGFNKTHHQGEAIEHAVHIHDQGKTHEHHDSSGNHHHDKKDKASTEDCCNDSVIKFQNLDKSVTQSTSLFVDAITFIALLNTSAFDINNLKVCKAFPREFIVRDFQPPPHNIRIAIRSFQI